MAVIGPISNTAEEGDVCSIELLDLPNPIATWGNASKLITGWLSYTVTSDFMTPVDSWTLEVASDHVQDLRQVVQNYQRVALRINGQIQATGYVDATDTSSTSSGGTTLYLQGRDVMSVATSTTIDPGFTFPETGKVKDLITQIFDGMGFKEVIVSDKQNRANLTGKASTFSFNDADFVIEKQILTAVNSKFKPHPSEGHYELAERIGRRFGYHIWASADGNSVICGAPDFAQEHVYYLCHSKTAPSKNNVLDAKVRLSIEDQSTVLVAQGHGSGGKFPKNAMTVIMANELVSDSNDNPAIQKVLNRYTQNVKVLDRNPLLKRPKSIAEVTKFPRVGYVYDDESRDKQQLENFVRRFMAEQQSKCLVGRYTVPGHSQNGVVWAVNTMVWVKDEVNELDQPMWIKSRTFTKDRNGGTKTTIEVILPWTLNFAPKDS